jgi:hypothetical protein
MQVAFCLYNQRIPTNLYNTQNYLFLAFAHRPEFQILRNTKFQKLDFFWFSGEGRETPL